MIFQECQVLFAIDVINQDILPENVQRGEAQALCVTGEMGKFYKILNVRTMTLIA